MEGVWKVTGCSPEGAWNVDGGMCLEGVQKLGQVKSGQVKSVHV